MSILSCFYLSAGYLYYAMAEETAKKLDELVKAVSKLADNQVSTLRSLDTKFNKVEKERRPRKTRLREPSRGQNGTAHSNLKRDMKNSFTSMWK